MGEPAPDGALALKEKVLAAFFKEVLGVDGETARRDAGEVELRLSVPTFERLSSFMEYVLQAPRTPLNLRHFSYHFEQQRCNGCCLARHKRSRERGGIQGNV